MIDLVALCYLMLASLAGLGLALWRDSYRELPLHAGVVLAVLVLL